MSRKNPKRTILFNPKAEDEDGAFGFDQKLFKMLTKELDEVIERAMEETYRKTLETLDRILKNPGRFYDHRVPTLFLCGHCLDWNWLFGCLRKRHKNLKINGNILVEEPERLATDIENESSSLEKKGGGKQILFFQETSFAKREVFERILSVTGENDFVLLLVHTSISFSSLEERISRLFFIQMDIINSEYLPSSDKFLDALFIENRAILPRAKVQFHWVIVQFVRQMFQREHKTLASVRKALVFALFEYATEYGREKRPNAKERKEFANVMERYFASLRAFVFLTETNELPNSENFLFTLHCLIQNGQGKFAAFYTKIKSKCDKWTNEKWQNKVEKIGEFIEDENQRKKCRELADKLGEQRIRSQNEQAENIEPPKKASGPGSHTSFRRSVKTAKMFADQKQLLTRLISPLDAQFRAELFQFLDSLFLPILCPFPDKFIAGPGNLTLLDPSLSVELDRCFSEKSDEINRLDIVTVYQLLFTFSSDFCTFTLSDLQKAFCATANCKPIEGLEKEARFLSAIAQLEIIGVVKSLPNDFVRLIYLPAAALE